ncbi:helix-turn-helix domain-containing protein [Mangrovihabitans endophyticus]|uniref:Transcriptional regulator n=1 Tax=Mangrovihabitans endophyticus TaxID=1751298 RepID=A0A8J3C279_9ACTN|nr:helix-turn-helix transcriptional regulator [Mangrovihabitans endophyticus]GGK98691.1 transcriptional regulator [Mangrovihabitans endophyticus]
MTEVSPTVARRRVRLALREAREAADLTQLQVADEMEWSLSKVIRIENGDVSISPNDLRPLLSYLGFKDRARINALIADAKMARTRGRAAWWQGSDFRELSETLRRLFEYEAAAVTIRSFCIRYVPGPLQLPEYADALTGSFEEEISDERAKTLIEARRLRREAMLSRLGKGLEYFAIFEEPVFLRNIGGAGVFLTQLRELYRLACEGLLKVRMLPLDLETPIANNATFDLLSLGDGKEGEVLYRENGLADELLEDKQSTSRHLDRFHQFWHLATDEADTISYIGKRIEILERATGQASVS